MKNELIKLANHLDRKGLHVEADYLDVLMKRAETLKKRAGLFKAANFNWEDRKLLQDIAADLGIVVTREDRESTGNFNWRDKKLLKDIARELGVTALDTGIKF